jgi:hypothetical protein
MEIDLYEKKNDYYHHDDALNNERNGRNELCNYNSNHCDYYYSSDNDDDKRDDDDYDNDDLCLPLNGMEQYCQVLASPNNQFLEDLNKKVRYEKMAETINEYLVLLTEHSYDDTKTVPILMTLYNMVVINPLRNNPSYNIYRSIFIELNGMAIVQDVQQYWKDNIEVLQKIEQILYSCTLPTTTSLYN